MLSEKALAQRESKYWDPCSIYGHGRCKKQISIEKNDLYRFENDFDNLILYAFHRALPDRKIKFGILFGEKKRTLMILHKHCTGKYYKNHGYNSDSGWMHLWSHDGIKEELQNIWKLKNSRNASIIFPLRFNFCMDMLI